jgi:hypothetical protein
LQGGCSAGSIGRKGPSRKGVEGRKGMRDKRDRQKKGVKNRGKRQRVSAHICGVVALIRTNSHLCLERAFLLSFSIKMSGFQDLLREKCSSLFMLSGKFNFS